ncbi:MAG: mechanosensitive ion channel family protein [Cytophagales bacterium]|nr:mechanosensitive ion channel family protein [Cytophagales bacterium]
MKELLEQTYYGNSVQNYLEAVAIIVGGLLLLRLFRKRLLAQARRWAEKTETKWDDYLVKGLEKFGLPIFNFVVIYIGLSYLTLPERADKLVHNALGVVFTFYAIRLLSAFIRLLLESFIKNQPEGAEKLKQLNGIMLIINVVIWGIGLLFLFDNLGYDVTAIIAGLGIGGIAIALAAQNILGDLFNYFVIFFDRPFEVGDYITVDDKKGTVEYIGIKTTRLISAGGEQLAFANSDLTKSRIHNFKRMNRRRIVFSIGVVYNTPAEQLARIPAIIEQIIKTQPLATFDRAHFARFGAYSLDYEIVYFVEAPDYISYMNVQQEINLSLFKTFADAGIEFAFPTQTVLVAK